MPVNTTHAEYDANLAGWTRARRVMAGEDAVKAAGEAFLPRLELQTDAEYAAYKSRASFFNATSRTADGFVGLIFRRAPFVRLPDVKTGVGLALQQFENDVDLSGTTLGSYAQQMVRELVEVGRAGTLVDWEGGVENQAYVSLYAAEDILNWRVDRVNGRNLTTLVVLAETIGRRGSGADAGGDPFAIAPVEQIRVLRLVSTPAAGPDRFEYVVEIWQREEINGRPDRVEWKRDSSRTPLRILKTVPYIDTLPLFWHPLGHGEKVTP